MTKLVEVYLKGREKSTMKTYESSFRSLRRLCQDCGLSMFRLGEEERCQVWVQARERKLTPASVRGISAVINLLQEVMGEEENCSKREKTIKKALAKEGNLEVKRKKREPGTWGDVQSLVQDAEVGNQLKSWRTAALAVFCYFGCRRLSDVIRVRVKDVIVEEDRVIVWMRKQKNDEFNEGDSFSMVAEGNGFSIKSFLEKYMAVMDLKKKDALFPKSLRNGAKLMPATYAVMYQALEGSKERLGLDPNLTWHSFRIGSATRGTMLGVRRSVVKGAGKWRSNCVDLYCREEDPGMVLSQALMDDSGF